MNGTNAKTGKHLSGLDHLSQSVRDILTPPVGSRVMRRDYGSRLYQLVDAPINQNILLELYAATAEALSRWEPRLKLQRVHARSARPGCVVLELTGEYMPGKYIITLDGIEIT